MDVSQICFIVFDPGGAVVHSVMPAFAVNGELRMADVSHCHGQ
jgi:hypothetical protein